ncbi:hypothetical protein AAF712_013488 [Marasmius tenuissimus]|uniref:F-box domain-containing protein n=1 Tax=Marasmius tenuissimus TaxID=585030 RepID=A0ABR2ZDL6_9AGAR
MAMDIDPPLDQVGPAVEDYADCIGTITDYCTRWKSLSLCHIIPSVMKQFHRLSSKNLPLLEAFRDVGAPFNWPPSFDQSQTTFLQIVGNAPSLCKLQITIRAVTDFDPPIQWRQLRVLHIQVHFTLSDCVSLAQQVVESCPVLLECIISFFLTIHNQHQPSSALAQRKEWKHLRKLGISFSGGVDQTFYSTVFNIFESITTPVLTHLSLSSRTYSANDFENVYPRDNDLPFHNLIMRSQCPLKSLDLYIPFGAGLEQTLNGLASLTTLSLSSPAWDPFSGTNEHIPSHLDPVLQTLMSSEGSAPYPHIERLIFRRYPPQQAFALVDLIESRARSTRLRSFTVDFGDVFSNKTSNLVKSALESVESKQLDVRIEWNHRKPIPIGLDGPHIHVPQEDIDRFVL